jgi:regulator of protease activity HflC (stomatin/prohibitin superfamily)
VAAVVGIPHQPAEAAEAAGSHHPVAGIHHPEAEGQADIHHPEAEAQADTHLAKAKGKAKAAVAAEGAEAGSYQVAVAVDRSWTPSSDEISWQRAC